MTQDPTGAAAPSGGFQNGGWYGGYQYFNGSFAPQAGMIHPQSPQQGAGQMVSSQVNQQSDAAQGLKPGTIDSYVSQQNNPQNNPNAGNAIGANGLPNDAGTASGAGAGVGFQAPATINLPGLYDSLSKSEGITDLQNQLTQKQQAYNDAQAKINDNPFLSESSRVGRVAKLTTDYNNDIKTTQDSLAMKQADVQTRLDLQTKQYDINSQASQQAFSQFNSLLESGALNNASGQDIANITRATGISSSMILSAVKAQQEKNAPTSVIQFDDGTNQGFAVVNTKTGQVISKQVIAGSKPTKGSTKGQDQNGLTKQDYLDYLTNDAQNKITLKSLVTKYENYIPLSDIYHIYANNSPWGKPTESLAQVSKGIYADSKGYKKSSK